MSTSAQKRKAGDRGRVPYRFTAKQVMKMIATGIIADSEDVELWDGILYKMTKGELHNQIVMMTAKAIDRVADPTCITSARRRATRMGRIRSPSPT